jgi:deferrochelatase/peroxidase EfeB
MRMKKKFTRRGVLIGAGAVGAGALLASGGFAARAGLDELYPPSGQSYPFYGQHQPGIVTPAQDRLHFAAFDLVTERASDLQALLRIWSDAAATMMAGRPLGAGAAPVLYGDDTSTFPPSSDTGEALGLPASRLTITFGFGRTLFLKEGKDRYGLASRRSEALIELPPFPGDSLDPDYCGGDLCVQACADDPQVAFHAVRNLARLARGLAVLRWTQLGFGRTSSTSRSQETPRNLMGFKDGTNNLKAEDTALMEKHVWVGASDRPSWMLGGSYLVVRRIRMALEVWDHNLLEEQEWVIGREKVSGAPLGKKEEFDLVDLAARDEKGNPLVPARSHVRLAIGNDSIKILRRGYSFTDKLDARTGQFDAGLFFIAFQRDPRTQFVPLQMILAQHDALNDYITHTGSAIFACPPGAREGGFVGEGLFSNL